MFYVYLIEDEAGHVYIGYTSDLRRRVVEHNAGQNASTRGRTWSLLYYEAYVSERVARNREQKLKHHGRVRQLLLQRLRSE